TAMISRRVVVAFLFSLTLACGVISSACGGRQEGAASTNAGPTWKPTGNEGNITGAVSFTGQAPTPRKLDTTNDSACGEVMTDDVLVNDGKLQNVFVFVKSGLPDANFEIPATPITFDQRGCKYVPRILGIQTGQPLSVVNSDPTNHNIHPIPKVNREWNE